jgi:hypothetical protein
VISGPGLDRRQSAKPGSFVDHAAANSNRHVVCKLAITVVGPTCRPSSHGAYRYDQESPVKIEDLFFEGGDLKGDQPDEVAA